VYHYQNKEQNLNISTTYICVLNDKISSPRRDAILLTNMLWSLLEEANFELLF